MTGRRPLALLAGLAIVCAVAATSGGAFAVFSGQTSTPANSFASASSFSALRMATGTYTGDGRDNRSIDGPSFAPDVVIVKAATAQTAVLRTRTMSGDATKPMVGAVGAAADLVQSLTTMGFVLGADARVNASGVAYTWTAFKAAPGVLRVGSYVGTGAAQSVTGLGFSPEYVLVAGSGAQRTVQRATSAPRSYQFDADQGTTTRVTALGADGFTVGSGAETGAGGVTYDYVAFNAVAGSVGVGLYTGTGTNDRDVTSVGFAPDWVSVKADKVNQGGYAGQFRPASLSGTASHPYDAAGNLTTGIRALLSTGMRVGTDTSVNDKNTDYIYLATRNVP